MSKDEDTERHKKGVEGEQEQTQPQTRGQRMKTQRGTKRERKESKSRRSHKPLTLMGRSFDTPPRLVSSTEHSTSSSACLFVCLFVIHLLFFGLVWFLGRQCERCLGARVISRGVWSGSCVCVCVSVSLCVGHVAFIDACSAVEGCNQMCIKLAGVTTFVCVLCAICVYVCLHT